MALTDRLFENASVQLPGSIQPALKQELWNVVDDFCRETHAWQELINVPLTAGVTTYTPTPAGTHVLAVLSIAHETLDVSHAHWSFGTLSLTNAPTAGDVTAGDLYMLAALTPALETGADPESLIPEDMWTEHFQVLLEGLLGRMMGQPAKPYSNPTLAVAHLRNYRSKRSEARVKQREKNAAGYPTWRFPRLGWV